MIWHPQQEAALKEIKQWLKDPNKQVFKLFGFAGTGKTTLAKEIASFKKKTLFGAFSGKAAQVMRQKGCHDAMTIHSLIYKLEKEPTAEAPNPSFILNHESKVRKADLVIIDECSMVDDIMGKDLESFGTKILVLGDPFQLPPLNGQGYFTSGKPDFMLTEIHRQALDNPIISMSLAVREKTPLNLGNYGDSRIINFESMTDQDIIETDQIITGKIISKDMFNKYSRQLFNYTSFFPQIGEKVICLKNDREEGLFNGEMWAVFQSKLRGKSVIMDLVDSESNQKTVRVRQEFFDGTNPIPFEIKRISNEFDFGYALTCHKAQGSQWNNIVVLDESGVFRENKHRWLYTAITRAANKITIMRN